MPATSEVAAVGAFAITLKGWRSQLRWAMTQREEDPSRVWLEVISIDERLKLAEKNAIEDLDRVELAKFRGKLEESRLSLSDELGDEKVAPLYEWLDLVRQQRALEARVAHAREAVAQARAVRSPENAKAPETDEAIADELARAQSELAERRTAALPTPPPEVLAVWEAEGGDALAAAMPREPMAVGKKGEAARRLLEPAAGRTPGTHPWPGSKAEQIAVPAAGGITFVCGALSAAKHVPGLATLAVLSFAVLIVLVVLGALLRRKLKAETAAALDWAWHAKMYAERTHLAELEAAWLRALGDARKALRSFLAHPATGGHLRDFEADRPDLGPIVLDVARDTDQASAPASAGAR